MSDTITAIRVPVTGSCSKVEIPRENGIDAIYAAIEADDFDVVHVTDDMSFYVDGEGLLRENPMHNVRLETIFTVHHGGSPVLAGHGLITKGVDEEGYDAGFDDAAATLIIAALDSNLFEQGTAPVEDALERARMTIVSFSRG